MPRVGSRAGCLPQCGSLLILGTIRGIPRDGGRAGPHAPMHCPLEMGKWAAESGRDGVCGLRGRRFVGVAIRSSCVLGVP